VAICQNVFDYWDAEAKRQASFGSTDKEVIALRLRNCAESIQHQISALGEDNT